MSPNLLVSSSLHVSSSSSSSSSISDLHGSLHCFSKCLCGYNFLNSNMLVGCLVCGFKYTDLIELVCSILSFFIFFVIIFPVTEFALLRLLVSALLPSDVTLHFTDLTQIG
ncbi:hypothetical protein POUND7_003664 [Theobroma cacao]